MTTATATMPACPTCEEPAREALEMRNNEGALTRVRYRCSNLMEPHVWNDPPLPKAEDATKITRHPFGATFTMTPNAPLTITAPRADPRRYTPVAPKAAKPKAKPPLPEQVCEKCGDSYTPKRADSRYCSVVCRRGTANAQRFAPRTERPCDRCGTVYLPRKATNRFCSRECQVQARIRRKSEARGPRPLCLNCQQPFRRRAVDHVYCSPACKAAGGASKRVVRAQLSLTERTCERDGCGKPYVPQRTDQRFCSHKCLKADGNTKRATWLTCPQCGGRFRRRTSRHIWCTIACREASKAAEQADPGEPVPDAATPAVAPVPPTGTPAETLAGLLAALEAEHTAAYAALVLANSEAMRLTATVEHIKRALAAYRGEA